jgi:hypothetical protein
VAVAPPPDLSTLNRVNPIAVAYWGMIGFWHSQLFGGETEGCGSIGFA